MQLEVGENLYIIKMNKGSKGEGDNVGELQGSGAKLLGLEESAPREWTLRTRREATDP